MAKSHSTRKTHRIQPGEPMPSGAPRRYVISSTGYVVLRWNRGDTIYEILEHRYLAGNPSGPVHHRNHIKTDNRTENLEPVGTPSTHGERHRRIDRAAVVKLYEHGWTTLEIAARLNANAGQVSRILKSEGVKARVPASYWEKDVDLGALAAMHMAGAGSYKIAEALKISQCMVMRRIRLLGLPRHQIGRRRLK